MKALHRLHMTTKRFLIPSIIISTVLFALHFFGIDRIINSKNNDTTNLTKYVQAQRYIIQKYYGTPNISLMYKESIKYMLHDHLNITFILKYV